MVSVDRLLLFLGYIRVCTALMSHFSDLKCAKLNEEKKMYDRNMSTEVVESKLQFKSENWGFRAIQY